MKAIEVYGNTVKTITVGKNLPDPFAKVWTQPMHVGGLEVPQVAVMIENKEGEPQFIASHSPDYRLVHNSLVSQTIEDVLTRAGYAGQRTKVVWDGKRFSEVYRIPDVMIDVRGEQVALGIEGVNSYDGSRQFGVQFFAERLVCSNGMYIRRLLGGFMFKHVMGGVDFEDAVNELHAGAERFMELAPYIERLMATTVDLDTLLEWHRRLKALSPKWPDSRTGEVLNVLARELPSGAQPTAWNLLNAFTWVTTHKLSPFSSPRLSDNVMEIALSTVS